MFDTVSNTINSGADLLIETTKKSIHPYAPYYITKGTAVFTAWGSAHSLEMAVTKPGLPLSSRLQTFTIGLATMVAAANIWISAR